MDGRTTDTQPLATVTSGTASTVSPPVEPAPPVGLPPATPAPPPGGAIVYQAPPLPPPAEESGSSHAIAFVVAILAIVAIAAAFRIRARIFAGVRWLWEKSAAFGYPAPVRLAVGALAAGVAVLLLVVGPQIPFVNGREAGARPALQLDLAKSVAAGLGGILAVFALYYTDRRHRQTDLQLEKTEKQLELTRKQIEVAEQGHLTERFTRAVDMLGATREEKGTDGKSVTVPNLEVRLGGIYALERLARDSPGDAPNIFKLLCAYVRENSKWDDEKEQKTEDAIKAWRAARKEWNFYALSARLPKPRADVQAALTVLGGEQWERGKAGEDAPPMDLTGADLRRADLREAHLERALLHGARLEGANLIEARLVAAYLGEARLEGAKLQRAQLEGAYLAKARLEGANLSAATGLTQWRIDGAFGDAGTVLPCQEPPLVSPAHWA